MLIEGLEHDFRVDRNSSVIATDQKGGMIKEQSVSALLLFEILHELKRISEAVDRPQ